MNCKEMTIVPLAGLCIVAGTWARASEGMEAADVGNVGVRIEQALRENAPTNRSLDACAIVYRVADGKQVAAVSIGDVGPNTTFEPGSVIKPLTLVAAMEEGVAKIDTEYSTNRDDPKYFRLPGDGDHVWPETMTVADGVVRSSNVVLAKLGVDVGVTNLVRTFQAFGIGAQGGRIPSLDRISRVMQPRLGIGQCWLATPHEIARAYVILANRGRSPWTGTRVVSAPTADAVTAVLRRVVSGQGTARRAAVEGVAVAGKTGTAQRLIDGKYGDEYQASFVGYFPAEKPQYLVLVTYRTKRDGDQFHQGGRRPAQAFRQIASFLMEETAEDALQVPLEAVLGIRHVVTDEAGRQARDEALKAVKAIMKETGTEREFERYEDGTPFFTEALTECDGAYPAMPCFVVVDDEAVHGGAIFPEGDVGQTNLAEFVSLSNQRIRKGRFVHDAKTGFVMYHNSVPMAEFRTQPKASIGMVFGFPVMQANLYSEAYRAVLKGGETPLKALERVDAKLREILLRQTSNDSGVTNAVQAIVTRYFADKGYDATHDDEGPQSIFGGVIERERVDGAAPDQYGFRLITSDAEAVSYVMSPVKVRKHAAEVRQFVSRLNRQANGKGYAFAFQEPDDENDGMVSCRARLSVDELRGDVESGMTFLLHRAVETLEGLSKTLEAIESGKAEAAAMCGELRKTPAGEGRSKATGTSVSN